MKLKSIILILSLCMLLTAAAFSQAPAPADQNVYAAGISYNSSGSPSVAGTGLYAHKLADGTYAFTVVDALPISVRPFTVTTSFSAGIAQKIFSIGKLPIYIPTAAGIAYNGNNMGWAWSTGGMVSLRVKEHVRILPNIRVVKASTTRGSGYQPVFGILFGWGQ